MVSRADKCRETTHRRGRVDASTGDHAAAPRWAQRPPCRAREHPGPEEQGQSERACSPCTPDPVPPESCPNTRLAQEVTQKGRRRFLQPTQALGLVRGALSDGASFRSPRPGAKPRWTLCPPAPWSPSPVVPASLPGFYASQDSTSLLECHFPTMVPRPTPRVPLSPMAPTSSPCSHTLSVIPKFPWGSTVPVAHAPLSGFPGPSSDQQRHTAPPPRRAWGQQALALLLGHAAGAELTSNYCVCLAGLSARRSQHSQPFPGTRGHS